MAYKYRADALANQARVQANRSRAKLAAVVAEHGPTVMLHWDPMGLYATVGERKLHRSLIRSWESRGWVTLSLLDRVTERMECQEWEAP